MLVIALCSLVFILVLSQFEHFEITPLSRLQTCVFFFFFFARAFETPRRCVAVQQRVSPKYVLGSEFNPFIRSQEASSLVALNRFKESVCAKTNN